MNILIVKNDNSVALFLMEKIKEWGYCAETAGTGKEALAKLRQKKFDLALLDIFLPDIKGSELIPQFKGIWHDIGIVTMTGYNSRELELEVRLQGISYYMIKPFSMKEMKEILDHISRKKGEEVRRNGRISRNNGPGGLPR